ncbi:thioredoxin-like protein [Jimgerdemannia flammicorona]|uniref:Thioredoxin-like protein n=1 Tax=Jimgerdemannia flammicorona TaxID=994334 RepID=A0A433D1V9_9FUNG|nr:thioredoxin-like protein [Jimgerdemannia flammicorona]
MPVTYNHLIHRPVFQPTLPLTSATTKMDIDHDQADHDQTDDDQTDDIAQFCAITNATAEVAVGYLRASGGKVEMAIQFYLESEIGDPFPSVHSSRPAVHVPSPAPRNISSSFETDEEMARRLTEEDTDRVRAPIAPKREVLFGGGGGGLAGLPSVSVPALYGNLALPAHSTRSRTGATRIFNQQEAPGSSSSGHEAFRDFAAESASSQETRRTDKAKRLADLFRPPFDIMFKDDFDSARNKARAEMKWLMVNIQNVTEFACQVMNRDLWSDLPVKELVRENFVFMQYGSESTEGKRYINLYPIDNYPHVAIIDPKTAERVKVWNTVMEPIDFIMSGILIDFLWKASLHDLTEFLDSPTAFASRMKLPVPPKKKTSKV